MNRETFMSELKSKLAGMPEAELARVLEYYDELFSDSLEAGKTEEEIVAGLDSPEVIAKRVREEVAFVRAEREPSAKSLNTALLVLLGVFALPIGLPLAFAVFMVILSVGIVGLSLAFAAFAVLLALGVTGVALVAVGVTAVVGSMPLTGFALIGAGLVCAGIGLLTGIGAWALSRLLIRACAKLFRSIYEKAQRKKEARA